MAHKSFKNIALVQRFPLNYASIVAQGKPTGITLGAFQGFSFPVYNSDNEELFFGLKSPRRWDGATNPNVIILACLSNAEDVGDKFKFQLSWTYKSYGSGVISNAVTDVEVETVVATDRAAQYACYTVTFPIVVGSMTAGDLFEARLRRIASGSPAVSNEIIVLDAYINFKRTKLGVDWE